MPFDLDKQSLAGLYNKLSPEGNRLNAVWSAKDEYRNKHFVGLTDCLQSIHDIDSDSNVQRDQELAWKMAKNKVDRSLDELSKEPQFLKTEGGQIIKGFLDSINLKEEQAEEGQLEKNQAKEKQIARTTKSRKIVCRAAAIFSPIITVPLAVAGAIVAAVLTLLSLIIEGILWGLGSLLGCIPAMGSSCKKAVQNGLVSKMFEHITLPSVMGVYNSIIFPLRASRVIGNWATTHDEKMEVIDNMLEYKSLSKERKEEIMVLHQLTDIKDKTLADFNKRCSKMEKEYLGYTLTMEQRAEIYNTLQKKKSELTNSDKGVNSNGNVNINTTTGVVEKHSTSNINEKNTQKIKIISK